MPLEANLDHFVAGAAMRLDPESLHISATDIRNAVEKAIAVLSSQGLFAMFLWSYGKKDYVFVANTMRQIFCENQLIHVNGAPGGKKVVLQALQQELCNFIKIRFLEDLTLRILIYARHYLKSCE